MYVIIVGAGLIGKQLASMLTQNKHDVVVIDKNRESAESIYTETGAMTVLGNATDILVLEEAGAKKADVLLCLMKDDADNIACALLSRSLGVSRIIARLRNPLYEQAYKQAGVTTIVRLADLLINRIMVEIEQPTVKRLISIGTGDVNIYSVKIPHKAKCIGMSIREITAQKGFPQDCVFMGLFQEEEEDFLIPRGDNVIHEDDTVFLVSKAMYIKSAAAALTKNK